MKFISAAVVCFFGVSDAQRGWEPSEPAWGGPTEPAWGPTEPAWEKAPKWKAPKAAKGWNGGKNGDSNGGYNGGSWGGETDNGGAWGEGKDNGGAWGGGGTDNGGSWGGGGTENGGSWGGTRGNELTFGNLGCTLDTDKPAYWVDHALDLDFAEYILGDDIEHKMHCAVPHHDIIKSQPCEDTDLFKWKIIPLKENGFQIQNVGTGECVAMNYCSRLGDLLGWEPNVIMKPCGYGGVWKGSRPELETVWTVSNEGTINSYYCAYAEKSGNHILKPVYRCAGGNRRAQEDDSSTPLDVLLGALNPNDQETTCVCAEKSSKQEIGGLGCCCDGFVRTWSTSFSILDLLLDDRMFSFCNEIPGMSAAYPHY